VLCTCMKCFFMHENIAKPHFFVLQYTLSDVIISEGYFVAASSDGTSQVV
jgi:hypothetical protein